MLTVTEENENTGTTIEAPLNLASSIKSNPPNPVIIKILSFAVGTVLTSLNTTANCLIMIQLGAEGGCSLSTSYQSLFRNVCSGALLVCGVELGSALGKNDDHAASEIVVTSYALTGILTLLSSIAYGATYFVFPKIFAPTTAEAASTYLLWSGLGTWPSLALITTGQMAFQCGDWKSPLISTIVYRLPAAGLSYLLADTAEMGVKGVGIGNFIAPWIAYVGMELWLMRNAFSHIKQVRISKAIVSKHLKSMASRGFQMSSQKLTEWLNLLLVTVILARMDDNNLAIINPSVQLMNFFNLFSQGVGQGGNMILAKDHATMKNKIEQYKQQPDEALLIEIKALQKDITATAIKSYVIGIIINTLCAITLFAAKTEISDVFLAGNKTQSMHEVADTTLWINGLGLVADAMRIISGCILNTWDRILIPNIISFVLMSAIGIPLNFLVALGKDNDDAVISMFTIRTITIFLAALINTYLLYQCIMKDKNDIQALEENNANQDTQSSQEANTVLDVDDNQSIANESTVDAEETDKIAIPDEAASSATAAAAGGGGLVDGLYKLFGYGQTDTTTQSTQPSANAQETDNSGLLVSVFGFFSYGAQENHSLKKPLHIEDKKSSPTAASASN